MSHKFMFFIIFCICTANSQGSILQTYPPWEQIDSLIQQNNFRNLKSTIFRAMNSDSTCEQNFFYIFCTLNRIDKQRKDAVQTISEEEIEEIFNATGTQFPIFQECQNQEENCKEQNENKAKRVENLKKMYKIICELIQHLENPKKFNKKKEKQLLLKLKMAIAIERDFLVKKYHALVKMRDILKCLPFDILIIKNSVLLEMIEEEILKCERWRKYLNIQFFLNLKKAKITLKLLTLLKEEMREETLKNLGVENAFFQEQKKKEEKKKLGRLQNLKEMYKIICKLIWHLKNPNFNQEKAKELLIKLRMAIATERAFLLQKLNSLEQVKKILKSLPPDLLNFQYLQLIEADIEFCKALRKFLTLEVHLDLKNPKVTLELLKQMKKKIKEVLKSKGVKDQFFDEVQEREAQNQQDSNQEDKQNKGSKENKENKEDKEENQENQESDGFFGEYFGEYFFADYFESFLGCYEIKVVPLYEPSSNHVQVSLSPQQLQAYTSSLYGFSIQKRGSLLLEVVDIYSKEWTSKYGVPPNDACCSRLGTIRSGRVVKITENQILVELGRGVLYLKIKSCSQIHQLNKGTQAIYVMYEFNSQSETVLQYALLYDYDKSQTNLQLNQFNIQSQPQNVANKCPEGRFHNGYWCQPFCPQGLIYINHNCVPKPFQNQLGN